MTIDDLSETYRVEMKAATLSTVRRDLYPAMATLMTSLNGDYETLLQTDGESIMCEGANQRRRKARKHIKDIIDRRMRKIANMALLGAMGGNNPVDTLTTEEKTYYEAVMSLSKKHRAVVKRLSGDASYRTAKLIPDLPSTPSPAPLFPISKKESTVASVVNTNFAQCDDGTYAEESHISAPVGDFLNTEEDDASDCNLPEDELDKPPDGILEMKSSDKNAFLSPHVTKVPVSGPVQATPVEEEASDADLLDESSTVIRILENLPPFAGPYKDYDLSAEDVVRMPTIMANVLIKREKAVKVFVKL